MLWAILNKSWRQHPTKQKLYGHLLPITKIIQVRQTKYTGHCWKSRDELISDDLLWTPEHGRAKARRKAQTYSSSVRIRDVALRTYQKLWTIGRSSERSSRISVLVALHDDDGDDEKKPFKSIQIWDWIFLMIKVIPSHFFLLNLYIGNVFSSVSIDAYKCPQTYIYIYIYICTALSAIAVEYTGCISVED